MRHYRRFWYMLVGVVVAAVVTAAAPALAGSVPGAPTGTAVKMPSAPHRADRVISQFVKQAGARPIRNQNVLSVFRSWIIRQPGFARSGWVGSIDHLAHKAMTVLWYGPRTPLLTAIVREGARRGIAVTVQHRRYSLPQLEAAATAIWKQAAQGKWAGFHVSAVATVSAADNGITVAGTYTKVPAARRAPQVQALATVVNGVPVRLAPGHSVALWSTRHGDSVPFYAGGLMEAFYNKNTYCSNGFTVFLNGATHATTARHCARNDWVVPDVALAPNPPPVRQWYGDAGGTSSQGAGLILGNYGGAYMWNHGWNSSTFSNVIGYGDLGLGDLVCSEGGMTGEWCNIKVEDLSVWINDGYGPVQTIYAVQQTPGAIAGGAGDSGGPIMSLKNTPSGWDVRAAGMVQAGDDVPGRCPSGSTYTGTSCGYDVYFSSMRTIIATYPGAALWTTSGPLSP